MAGFMGRLIQNNISANPGLRRTEPIRQGVDLTPSSRSRQFPGDSYDPNIATLRDRFSAQALAGGFGGLGAFGGGTSSGGSSGGGSYSAGGTGGDPLGAYQREKFASDTQNIAANRTPDMSTALNNYYAGKSAYDLAAVNRQEANNMGKFQYELQKALASAQKPTLRLQTGANPRGFLGTFLNLANQVAAYKNQPLAVDWPAYPGETTTVPKYADFVAPMGSNQALPRFGDNVQAPTVSSIPTGPAPTPFPQTPVTFTPSPFSTEPYMGTGAGSTSEPSVSGGGTDLARKIMPVRGNKNTPSGFTGYDKIVGQNMGKSGGDIGFSF